MVSIAQDCPGRKMRRGRWGGAVGSCPADGGQAEHTAQQSPVWERFPHSEHLARSKFLL